MDFLPQGVELRVEARADDPALFQAGRGIFHQGPLEEVDEPKGSFFQSVFYPLDWLGKRIHELPQKPTNFLYGGEGAGQGKEVKRARVPHPQRRKEAGEIGAAGKGPFQAFPKVCGDEELQGIEAGFDSSAVPQGPQNPAAKEPPSHGRFRTIQNGKEGELPLRAQRLDELQRPLGEGVEDHGFRFRAEEGRPKMGEFAQSFA